MTWRYQPLVEDPEYYEDADQNWQDFDDEEQELESYDPYDTVNS
jgi:hypothetical protein